MPQTKKIDINKLPDIPEQLNNTKDFKNIKPYIKKKQWEIIPTLSISKELAISFRKEAKLKKWKLSTLMEQILIERYGKENNNNEDD
ncbi:hypothetical protein [Spiroplasma endosymbiont of Glossina fuscipes fuscipes]|uniref:hypothetical protein n=1 Tax=Spiroplasma endosymbiont of Glossina fuscipes fuscipes TaxID=2004463 RepID=UPI003C71EDFD